MAPLELGNISSALQEIPQDPKTKSSLDGEYHRDERDDKRPRLESTSDGRPDIEASSPLDTKSGKPRPYICGTCSRSFARLEHLKRHERSHVKVKPFECSECTRCFARRDLLLRHQQALHMTTGTPSTTTIDHFDWNSLGSPTAIENAESWRYSSRESDFTNPASSPSRAGRRESNDGLYDQMKPITSDDDFGWMRNWQGRGRTPERTAGSRASSSSSVRTMIDERLEWAHQDRVRSASRRNSVQQSPFHEHSPFYAEFAAGAKPTQTSPGVYICECCPKKPKEFNTQNGLTYACNITLPAIVSGDTN